MDTTKYGKYIITEAKLPAPPPGAEAPRPATGERTGEMVLLVTDEVIKGAFYLNCALIWKASDKGSPGIRHAHNDYDEYVGFMGSNPADPHDLCGEVEFWLDDEKHILTKSCAVFIPKGTPHCPLVIKRVGKPIVFIDARINE